MNEVEGRDWKYFAEGGGHLLLTVSQDEWLLLKERKDSINPESEILRIPKYLSSIGKKPLESPVDYALKHQSFITNIMKVWFPAYMIADSTVISLDETFLSRIIENVAKDRPIGRKKKPLQLAPFGYLEPNLFHFSSLSMTKSLGTNRNESFSWELKVKCGLRSISPFVELNNLVKWFHNRYKLTQYYKEYLTNQKQNAEHQVLGWGRFLQKSNYQPRDLCSKDTKKLKIALTSLLENPQNNLGVFYQGSRCYGWDMNDQESFNRSLRQFLLPFNKSPTNQCLQEVDQTNFIHTILALIMKEEKMMESIERMQSLDFIDSEGSDQCYSRLKGFFPTEEEAQQYLLEFFCLPLQPFVYQLADLIHEIHCSLNRVCWIEKLTTLQLPLELARLVQLAIQVHAICLKSSDDIIEFEESRSLLRDEARRIIDESNLELISLLLKLWMLGAISKDCSVIISIKHTDLLNQSDLMAEEFQSLIKNSKSSDLVTDMFQAQKQSMNSFGKVFYHDRIALFDYKIAIIDIGLKDFSKFTTRKMKDDEICEVFKEYT